MLFNRFSFEVGGLNEGMVWSNEYYVASRLLRISKWQTWALIASLKETQEVSFDIILYSRQVNGSAELYLV